MTYYKYAERQVDTRINWAEVGKDMSDMLLEERKLRERKRQEINDASQQFGETLADAPTGDYDAGNTFTLDAAEAAQETRRMQDHFLKSGQMGVRDYTIGRQNVQSGISQTFDLGKTYQAEYAEKRLREDKGESQAREGWEMIQAEGLANLRDSRIYINPTNGVVSVGKLYTNQVTGVKELDPNQNTYVTVNELNKRLKMKYNRFNVDAAAENATKQLGALEIATMEYAGTGNVNQIVTQIDAKKHNFGLAGENWAAAYKDWEKGQVSAMMVNPNNVTSVLTDRKRFFTDGSGKKIPYTFTFDKKEYQSHLNKGQMIYLDRSKDANGIPVFNKAQQEVVEQELKLAVRATIDVKRQVKTGGTNQFEPASNIKATAAEKLQDDAITKAAQLWYGNQEEKEKAAESLRAFNDNIKEISLTDDGLGVHISYNNQKPAETIGFGSSQIDFLEGIGNFVLPTTNKIANISEVAKRSGLDLDKALLSGAQYAFSSMGEQPKVSPPFEEAFKNKEGAKFDMAKILQHVDEGITEKQEELAMGVIQSVIESIPGAKDIKTEDWVGGMGITVKIPKSTNSDGNVATWSEFDINMDDPNLAEDQLQAAIDAIIGYASNKASMELNIVGGGTEQYVKDYTNTTASQRLNIAQNPGGGVPRPAGN